MWTELRNFPGVRPTPPETFCAIELLGGLAKSNASLRTRARDSLFQGLGVGDFEMICDRRGEGVFRRASDERLQHQQVGGARFVQPCQHRVDGPYAPLRGNEDFGPALAWMGRAVPFGDRLEGAHVFCYDGDHT